MGGLRPSDTETNSSEIKLLYNSQRFILDSQAYLMGLAIYSFLKKLFDSIFTGEKQLSCSH